MVFDKFLIRNAKSKIGINPDGGYVSSWEVKNPSTGRFEKVLYQGKTQKRSGIPILFPYFGKAEGKRNHGFGRDEKWDIENLEDAKAAICLKAGDISQDARSEYPYQFSARIIIEAVGTGLIYSLEIKNCGSEPMPVSPGLHPYWAVAHDLKKKVTIKGLEEFNASQTDWDQNPPDNIYPFKGEVVLVLPDKSISIDDITGNEEPVIKHIVVWSQSLSEDDYDFICVEPVTGTHKALVKDPILIKPDEEWRMKLRFSVFFGNQS